MFRSIGKGDAYIDPVTTGRHTVASRWGSHLPHPCPLAPDIHQQTVYGSHHDWTVVGLQAAHEIETFSLMVVEQSQQDSSHTSSASVAQWQEPAGVAEV
jgi:hypothetical protein